MRHEPVPHDDLIKARDGKRYKGYSLRLHAVTAEIGEQEKEHRDITQVLLAEFFGVDPKTLRTWVDRYREHGLEGLRALGGQGASPTCPASRCRRQSKRPGIGRAPEHRRGRGRQLRRLQGGGGGKQGQGGGREEALPQGAAPGVQVQAQGRQVQEGAPRVQVQEGQGMQVQVLPRPHAAAEGPAPRARMPAGKEASERGHHGGHTARRPVRGFRQDVQR